MLDKEKMLLHNMKLMLLERYDFIEKMDAIKFLKEYFPNENIQSMIKSYNMAYEF